VNFSDGPTASTGFLTGGPSEALSLDALALSNGAESRLPPTAAEDHADATSGDPELGPGAVTWEGSFVLCSFIETCCELEAIVGLRCLELGAGTSVCV